MELSRLQIDDSQLAWQLKNLLDRLCLLEVIYNDIAYESSLDETEKQRYLNDVFPAMLTQCKKMADYFLICPELRNTKEDLNVLSVHFQRYVKITDRLLSKLQDPHQASRSSFLLRVKDFFIRITGRLKNIAISVKKSIQHMVAVVSPLLLWYPCRRTEVTYHRDSIDYAGNGYVLQLIPPLSVECVS